MQKRGKVFLLFVYHVMRHTSPSLAVWPYYYYWLSNEHVSDIIPNVLLRGDNDSNVKLRQSYFSNLGIYLPRFIVLLSFCLKARNTIQKWLHWLIEPTLDIMPLGITSADTFSIDQLRLQYIRGESFNQKMA